MSDPLVEARQALIGGEEARALDKVVESWRTVRSPKIATLAEKLSKRLEPHLPTIGGKLDAFQPLWLEVAKKRRAVDLPRLLGSVLNNTDRFGVAVVDALVARGKALAQWPADPRASAIIVDHMVAGGYERTSKSTYPFWSVLFEMLEKAADPRIVDRLSKIRFSNVFRTYSDGAKRIAWFQAQLDGVLERIAAHDTDLPAKLDERVTKLAKLIAARGPVPPKEVANLSLDPKISPPSPKRAAPPPKLDTKSARGHVDIAVRALQTGDDAAALRALLDAWRATRATRLAELVERVSRRLESRSPPIQERTRAATHAAWLAICREHRAEDLPRLLASLTATEGRSTDAKARLDALASWPSDPRTFAGAIFHLERPRFYASSTRPFWKQLLALVVDHHDPRAAEALEALASRFKLFVSRWQDLSTTIAWFKKEMLSAAEAIRTRVPAPLALDSPTAKACDKLAGVLATEDNLLAEIVANPDDDEPRGVYADLLQQRGDPRGEFITLQLAKREPERCAELLGTHAKSWLGPLAYCVDLERSKWERGFLVEVALAHDDVDTAIGHPMWVTVRKLDLGDIPPPAALLRHPVMAGLQECTIIRDDAQRWVQLRAKTIEVVAKKKPFKP